ncbi:MAG: MCE family protein [Nitrosomonas sp.]|nr:MCE family protein [Nitrosomonas sp.]
MNEKDFGDIKADDLPEAIPENKSARISIVWLIPLIALLIGVWLGYKAWSEMGSTIEISFKSARGLEAGKTKIKYKNVEIGTVEKIELSADMSHVILTANMVKSADAYLTEATRFWIVRARVAANEVSGLETILSGAYIGIDPDTSGTKTKHFSGLDSPPVVTKDLTGRHFYLRSDDLGSLDLGSPVYYRKIQAGSVISQKLADNGQSVILGIFIHSPYDQFVNRDTRFWNASGFELTLDANGVKMNTESLVTMMVGGIAFENPGGSMPTLGVDEWQEFILYENFDAITEGTHLKSVSYLLYFSGSVRGLNIGAPVELKGIKLGQVTGIKMEYNPDTKNIKIPVTIELQMDRITVNGFPDTTTFNRAPHKELLEELVQQGLRARLLTGNYVTGQLLIDLDFHQDASPMKIDWETIPPLLPTIPTPLETISNTIFTIVKRLEKLPLEKMGKQLYQTILSLTEIMKQTEALSKNLNTTLAPTLIATLQQTESTLATVEKILNEDSPVQLELSRVMDELSMALRSIRLLADNLEQNPSALIYGKGETP